MTMIDAAAATKLRALAVRYRDVPPHPLAGWTLLTDGRIWLRVVKQIAVVGKEAPGKKIDTIVADADAWYTNLATLSATAAAAEIHRNLKLAGSRFAGRAATTCLQTAAACKTLRALKRAGGPKAYMRQLSELPTELERLRQVREEFGYMGPKSSRNLLFGLGLVENAIALDSEIKKILEQVGARLPARIEAKDAPYQALEKELSEKVCAPLAISLSHFDRMLYENRTAILERTAAPKKPGGLARGRALLRSA